MEAVTREIIGQFSEMEWFFAAGCPIDAPEIVQVSSWSEATRLCMTEAWQNLRVEAVQRFWVDIGLLSPMHQAQWDEHIGEIRPEIASLVARKTAPVVTQHNLPPGFGAEVEFDFLYLAMELECLDITEAAAGSSFFSHFGAFRGLAGIYQAGHFPCGWEGQPPAGRMLVY